jgi:hypothetical protein
MSRKPILHPVYLRTHYKKADCLLQWFIRCDQLKNKSSRRVTYGNPCYSIGSKANSIYFLNDRSVACP